MSRTLANRASASVVDGFFSTMSKVGRVLPGANPKRHGVEIIENLSYGPHGEANVLDIWRPKDAEGPLPVVLYIHGGGFRSLSKDSHWIMALVMARHGYLVATINYRLSPEHAYPSHIQDACAAWLWTLNNVAEYGGDPSRMVVAGESAGANLAMALTVACCYPRPEPWAKAVFDAGTVPLAVAPACGLFQVSDMLRYKRAGLSNIFSQEVLSDCEDCYLPEEEQRANPGLADPVCIIEQTAPSRPLPPAFLPVGGSDPLAEDNQRLSAALSAREVDVLERVYPGEPHAFHALIFRKAARECWRDMLAFIDGHLA
jgi:acetyl esterase